MIKRGLFILFLELTLVNFSWFGAYQTLYLQVMWIIGLSMLCLAGLSKLARKYLLALSLIIIFGHNLLSPITFESNEFGYSFWTILHDRGYLLKSAILNIKISYPLLPWIGVIGLGYCAGPLFHSYTEPAKREKWIVSISCSAIALLLILRGFNIYGESLAWSAQASCVETVMSFLNFTKYPPSLDFILFGLGVGGLLLVLFERFEGKMTRILAGYGSAPLFFYLLHLYVLLFSYKIAVAIWGINKEVYFGVDPLWKIWCIGAVLAVALYYPTKLFSRYKRKSSSRWIKYL